MEVKICECIIVHLSKSLKASVQDYLVFSSTNVMVNPEIEQGLADCERCHNLRRLFDTEDEMKLFMVLFK